MSILKKPYEISLWEDILTFVVQGANGLLIEYEGSIPSNATGQVIAQYYKERKICVIGSDTMDTPIRAINPKLVRNVNGTNTLTFSIYSQYYEEESEEFHINPFVGLLINERKVKLRYGALGAEDTKWFDLIIKNINENSESKTFEYTAKDIFINELSKSGFNLEFNSELENNMGNITTLAEVILEESDWRLKEGSDILQQTKEEPLYEITLNQRITANNMGKKETITIESGEIIYGFYSNIVNRQPFFQFLYAEKYKVDDDYVIINSPNWYIENTTYNDNNLPAFAASMTISNKYRGKSLVRRVVTKYDATVDKYVNVYKDGNEEIYGYTETEYISPVAVRSYITNPNSYDTYSGWEVGGVVENDATIFPKIEVVSVPDVRDVDYNDIDNIEFTSCLKLEVTKAGQKLYNSGIVDHRQYINGFVKGEEYIFRIKYGEASVNGNYGAMELKKTDKDLEIIVGDYVLSDGIYNINNIYFQGSINSSASSTKPEYIYSTFVCKKSLSYSEMTKMTKSLGIFIQPSSAGTFYIEDVQFFKYIDNGKNFPLLPDEITDSEVRTIYYYYKPNDNYKSEEDIVYIYKGENPASYDEVYSENEYEKIRSITASESNRFNLIQDLCEIFQCWVKFEIEHNSQTGEILLDENYRQLKWITFHEYLGKENCAGFKYGINLKSIKRVVESEDIVSKLVVKDNDNEFATDGFCSIARASENPNGENFILDFGYYIQQGLLNLSEITNDLYLDTNGYIGYYKKLKSINDKRDKYIKEQSGLLSDISQYTASYQTYSLSVTSAEEQLRNQYIKIESLTSYTFQELMENKEINNDESNKQIVDWWENEQVNSIAASIGRLKTVINNHTTLREQAQTKLNKAQERYDWLNRALTSKEKAESSTEERLLLEKEQINKNFYKKYSRFLQEGSWISEDYIDDNLYYLDAESTLHTSAYPKVTYNIDVLEISQVEGYENYTYELGDKTYMEDTEFFGWVFGENGAKTPYKEEIVVTELTIMLDSPELNQIKVQNYKTQFEDLFQRMAATTQSVEYSTGQYKKVANIIETDGTINITTLQNSFANNALTIQNAKDQSVVWDETGITTTSTSNPAEIVRITSGGIFLSVDGGVNWYTGVTGKGINASYITSGQLDVQEINIKNGSFSSFRWDNTGINAYEFKLNEQTGEVSNFNFTKFIRFDQYGLYGINGYSNFSPIVNEDGLIGEEKIWKHSNFALTWKGFQIKSNNKGGYISITSDRDFQVFNEEGIAQVEIGQRSSGDNPLYGIRISDNNGKVSMEQTSNGKMWIRDELKIGETSSSLVSIGFLEKSKEVDGQNFHEVINANNNFIVYENGEVVASQGTFKGTIVATGGSIGGVEIEQIKDMGYEVSIESDSGTVFKNGIRDKNKVLTAFLWRAGKEITQNLSYQWQKNGINIENAINKQLEVAADSLGSTGRAVYGCIITINDATN